MNIKILDPIPESEVLVTIPFGSQVYGTATKDSDHDYVKILKQDTGSLILQYRNQEEGFVKEQVDYVYTDLKKFLAVAQTGSNVIFFEAMHTKEYQDWTNHLLDLEAYYTPQIAKAYLGLAKRDIPYPSRLHHVARCIWMAKKILKKELIDLKDVATIPPLDWDPKAHAIKIKALRDSIVYG